MAIETVKNIGCKILSAANHDFCPSCNWMIDWCKQPIGWVVAAIGFSFLVGLQVGPQGYVLCFGFIALLILGLVWPWISMKGVACELMIPEVRLREGESLTLVFRVRNFWPLPIFGMMVKGDFLQELEENAEPVMFSLRRVSAWSETEFQIPVTPRRRGRLPRGELQVTNAFPFGLKDISKLVSQSASIRVWPSVEPLGGYPKVDTNRFNLQGSLVDRSGNEGETIGVRQYRDGDQIRSVHWAQSIRSQRLMVRERQTPTTSAATVVIDLSPSHHTGKGIHNSFECAIRIGASLCNHLHNSCLPVRLVCLGIPNYQREVVDNRSGVDAMMDFLADLPTLDSAALACNAESRKAILSKQVAACEGRTFWVTTSASDLIAMGAMPAVQLIQIELEGIDGRNEVKLSRLVGQRVSDQIGIQITAPDLAPSQLAAGWSGSVAHEV